MRRKRWVALLILAVHSVLLALPAAGTPAMVPGLPLSRAPPTPEQQLEQWAAKVGLALPNDDRSDSLRVHRLLQNLECANSNGRTAAEALRDPAAHLVFAYAPQTAELLQAWTKPRVEWTQKYRLVVAPDSFEVVAQSGLFQKGTTCTVAALPVSESTDRKQHFAPDASLWDNLQVPRAVFNQASIVLRSTSILDHSAGSDSSIVGHSTASSPPILEHGSVIDDAAFAELVRPLLSTPSARALTLELSTGSPLGRFERTMRAVHEALSSDTCKVRLLRLVEGALRRPGWWDDSRWHRAQFRESQSLLTYLAAPHRLSWKRGMLQVRWPSVRELHVRAQFFDDARLESRKLEEFVIVKDPRNESRVRPTAALTPQNAVRFTSVSLFLWLPLWRLAGRLDLEHIGVNSDGCTHIHPKFGRVNDLVRHVTKGSTFECRSDLHLLAVAPSIALDGAPSGNSNLPKLAVFAYLDTRDGILGRKDSTSALETWAEALEPLWARTFALSTGIASTTMRLLHFANAALQDFFGRVQKMPQLERLYLLGITGQMGSTDDLVARLRDLPSGVRHLAVVPVIASSERVNQLALLPLRTRLESMVLHVKLSTTSHITPPAPATHITPPPNFLARLKNFFLVKQPTISHKPVGMEPPVRIEPDPIDWEAMENLFFVQQELDHPFELNLSIELAAPVAPERQHSVPGRTLREQFSAEENIGRPMLHYEPTTPFEITTAPPLARRRHEYEWDAPFFADGGVPWIGRWGLPLATFYPSPFMLRDYASVQQPL